MLLRSVYAGADRRQVAFVSPKVTKSIAAGFQRSFYVRVIECPRHSSFWAAVLTRHPCREIARFADPANLP